MYFACVCGGCVCASDKHAHKMQRRGCSSWVLPYNHVGPGVFRIMGSLISPPEQLWGAGSATLAHFRQNFVSQLCKKTHKQREVNGSFFDILMVLIPQRGLPFDLPIKGISTIMYNVISSSLQRTSAPETSLGGERNSEQWACSDGLSSIASPTKMNFLGPDMIGRTKKQN